MTFKELVNKNKDLVVDELYSWAETFIGEKDEEGEPTDVPFKKVRFLAKRLSEGKCTEQDYEDIEFHLWQINEGREEEPIILK
jgi:hypothetical protein